MSLLQLPALNKLSLTHPPPTASSSSSSSHFPPIRAFARIDHENPIFSPPPAIKERSLSQSTRPRKLLCRASWGKYLGEDYLVLAVEREKNAIIVKVDTDDEYEFARDMQVRGLPTVYFISPDPKKEAIRTESLIPLQMMRDVLDNDM